MAKLSSIAKSKRRQLMLKKLLGSSAKSNPPASDDLPDEAKRLIARLKMVEPNSGPLHMRIARKHNYERRLAGSIKPVTKEDKISSRDARTVVSRYLAGKLG